MARRRRRHRRTPSAARRVVALFLLLAAAALAVLFLIDREMRPILCAVAEVQLKKELTQQVGTIWGDLAEEEGFNLIDVMEISRNEDGSIAALTTDMERLSQLSAALSQQLTVNFGALERETISVPLGTALNLPLLSGLGWNVDTEIADIGKVSTDIYSDVASVGINQTVYQIRLNVTVDLVLLLPGGMEQLTVVSDSLLAETVLVGDVPNQYVTIAGDRSASDSSAIEK